MPDTLGGFNLNSAGFANLVQTAIHRDVVSLLRAEAVYAQPESVLPLEKVAGSTFIHRATLWTDVPASLDALSEGVPPSPTKMAEDDISVTVIEVGEYIPVFSQAEYQDGGALRLVMNATKKVARMVYLAFDNVAKGVYLAASTDVYGGGATSTIGVGPGDVLTTDLVDEMVTRARESDLAPFSDGLYRIVGHPRLFKPLLQEASNVGQGFANAANFGTVGDLKQGVVGDYHGAKFVSAGSRGIVLGDAAVTFGGTTTGDTTGGAAEDLFTTSVAHGLVAGDPIKFLTRTGGTLPTVGTTYYVIADSLTATTFRLSATVGGASIEIGATDITASTWRRAGDTYKGVLVGKQSIALSDMASLQTIIQPGGGPSDPLKQIVATIGFRGFIGGTLVEISNDSDGAGNLGATIRRSVLFEAAAA